MGLVSQSEDHIELWFDGHIKNQQRGYANGDWCRCWLAAGRPPGGRQANAVRCDKGRLLLVQAYRYRMDTAAHLLSGMTVVKPSDSLMSHMPPGKFSSICLFTVIYFLNSVLLFIIIIQMRCIATAELLNYSHATLHYTVRHYRPSHYLIYFHGD